MQFSGVAGAALQIEQDWRQSNNAPELEAPFPLHPRQRSKITTSAPELSWWSAAGKKSNVWREVKVSWDPDGYHLVSPVLDASGVGPMSWSV